VNKTQSFCENIFYCFIFLLGIAVFLNCSGFQPLPRYTTKPLNVPKFVLPVKNFKSYRISSKFGAPRDGGSRKHKGIDISGNVGENIFAIADGKITFSGWKNGYGNVIDISHGNGWVSRYAHNLENLKIKQDKIKAGETIAKLGNTGVSSGPHLHLEIWKNGEAKNPLLFIYPK